MCPYKFALQGVYKLRPRDESAPLEQMDPLTRGALFHEIQFELFQQLQRADLLPVNQDRLVEALALADPNVQAHTAGKTIKKVVIAKGRLVSVVVA